MKRKDTSNTMTDDRLSTYNSMPTGAFHPPIDSISGAFLEAKKHRKLYITCTI
jgi:hypothetical protein